MTEEPVSKHYLFSIKVTPLADYVTDARWLWYEQQPSSDN